MPHARTFSYENPGLKWLALLTLAGGIGLFLLLSAAGAQQSSGGGVIYDGTTSTANTINASSNMNSGSTIYSGAAATTGVAATGSTTANSLALQGVLDAYNSGDFEAALAGWDDVSLPARTAEWKSIGQTAIQLRNGDLAEAQASLTTALRINPQNPVAHYYLGLVYLNVLADGGVNVPLPGTGNNTAGRNSATPYFTDSSYSATPYFTDKSLTATPYFVDQGTSLTGGTAATTPIGSTIQNDGSVSPNGTGTTSTSGMAGGSTSGYFGGTSSSLGTTTATGASTTAGNTGISTATGTGATSDLNVDLPASALLQAAALEFQLAVALAPGLDETEPLLDLDATTGVASPTVGDLMAALQVSEFESISLKLLAAIYYTQGSYGEAANSLMLGMSSSESAFSDFELVGASLAGMDQNWAATLAYLLAFRNDLSGGNFSTTSMSDAAASAYSNF